MLPTSETELSWASVTTLPGGPHSQRPQGPTGAPTSLSHPVQALDPVQLARAMVSCFPHALDLLALCSVLCKGPHPHARASFNPLLFGAPPPPATSPPGACAPACLHRPPPQALERPPAGWRSPWRGGAEPARPRSAAPVRSAPAWSLPQAPTADASAATAVVAREPGPGA